ncbi:hypothetical protein [Streptomyces sp. NPDC090057]|uniref:hypothetical protein n=1 Tax=Streptomyces sp. NPDC090057 TaxID=3365935 RepID=UPI003811FAB8
MPRGRHRHSPPLHRLLPPSAIAGVSVVCALGPWVFSEATVLRVLAAAAAATAVAGAVVMRRWDTHAGKQVADLTRARASDEWRFEERVAELETDLEESRELRTKLERRLRAKRAELAGLRNEHAALLRRYATAETERASALEGRRLLEIEAGEPSGALALPPARSAEPEAPSEPGSPETADAAAAAEPAGAQKPEHDAVFSPEGSRLYLRAATALARFDAGTDVEAEASAGADVEAEASAGTDADVEASAATDAEASAEPDAELSADPDADAFPEEPANPGTEASGRAVTDTAFVKSAAGTPAGPRSAAPAPRGAAAKGEGAPEGVTEAAGSPRSEGAVQEDEARGKPGAAGEHTRPAAATTAPAEPAKPAGRQPAGHFTVPTAVAVVPAAPARRPAVEGGFDFFGTHKHGSSEALESVQNEDLADVVGQEALALHKAEAEAEFKTADEQARGVGQVIDLTAHDETEQIDVQGLRSAAS